MTTVGIISDTHGTWDERFITHLSSCDEIWHAGDIGSWDIVDRLSAIKPLKAVYGNIDGGTLRQSLPEHQIFLCEEVKVLMTHIGGYPNRYARHIPALFKEHQPTLFVCGHSHILRVMYDQKYQLLCVNPGAAGNFGFHQVRTLMRLRIDKSKIKDAEVIELGRR